MSLIVYWIDAFAEQPFEGNPAVVAPLEDLAPDDPWPNDELLQAMASEHNQSETAFIRPGATADERALRWFTPTTEVPMCGHATLAAGAVVLDVLSPQLENVRFDTRGGVLSVARAGEHFALDLPSKPRRGWEPPASLGDILEAPIAAGFAGEYPCVVLGDEDAVRGLDATAGITAAQGLHDARAGCLTVTAPGEGGLDFVSRFFAPGVGIPEDPFTGSSFADLAPYWAERLGKTDLCGFQASPRGGHAGCRVSRPGWVTLTGGAVEYMRGEVRL